MDDNNLTLTASTLKKVNDLATEFEKTRNLGGSLRIIAIKARANGDFIEKIANLVRTTRETVREWISDFVYQGAHSFTPKTSCRRPRSLTSEEEKILIKIIENTPSSASFCGGSWSTKKVCQFILNQFQRKLSKKCIPELLKKLGLSLKKARLQVRGRNEQLREQWLEWVWSEIVKTAELQDAPLLLGDLAHFSIFGTTGYAWAPKNAECIIESTGSKKGLHVMGAINYKSANTYAMILEEMVDEDAFICFLKMILSETRNPIHLIIDNADYHKSKKVKEFARKNSRRLTLHSLRPYNPDYNPMKGLWKKIQAQTTHNVYFPSIKKLNNSLKNILRWLRDTPSEVSTLFGFYKQFT